MTSDPRTLPPDADLEEALLRAMLATYEERPGPVISRCRGELSDALALVNEEGWKGRSALTATTLPAPVGPVAVSLPGCSEHSTELDVPVGMGRREEEGASAVTKGNTSGAGSPTSKGGDPAHLLTLFRRWSRR